MSMANLALNPVFAARIHELDLASHFTVSVGVTYRIPPNTPLLGRFDWQGDDKLDLTRELEQLVRIGGSFIERPLTRPLLDRRADIAQKYAGMDGTDAAPEQLLDALGEKLGKALAAREQYLETLERKFHLDFSKANGHLQREIVRQDPVLGRLVRAGSLLANWWTRHKDAQMVEAEVAIVPIRDRRDRIDAARIVNGSAAASAQRAQNEGTLLHNLMQAPSARVLN